MSRGINVRHHLAIYIKTDMRNRIILCILCLLLVGCSRNSSKYDIIGTWQVASGSSGNDLGEEYTEDINYQWYISFEKNGKLKEVKDREDGGVHTETSTWSISGDMITMWGAEYKVVEYNPKKLIIRYDSEYSEYQGKKVHSWLQYKLIR